LKSVSLPALAKYALLWDRITVTLSDERWVDANITYSQTNAWSSSTY
jgi:6-phosphogluconolactonase